MNITSFRQHWETFAALFPPDVSPDTPLYANLRDTFYAGGYHALMTITEDLRALSPTERTPALVALRHEITAYCEANLKSHDIS
jgi:hypothetical protein